MPWTHPLLVPDWVQLHLPRQVDYRLTALRVSISFPSKSR